MTGNPARERILGTCQLVSVVREEPSGTVDQFGPSPVGYINYAPDGRMMVINVRSDRTRPAGAVPTPEEAQALFNSVLAYGGTYELNGNEITHHVDISWNETWTGSDQTRVFRFEGELLKLSTRPSPDPRTGTISVRTMTWEKVK